jgi:hypothetical protein
VVTADEIKKNIEEKWVEFLHANTAKLSLKTLVGATPPSVFVGRFGYPKVKVGPMVSPLHGNTKILDMPEMWTGKTIGDIINFFSSRSSLRLIDAYVYLIYKSGSIPYDNKRFFYSCVHKYNANYCRNI